MTTPNRTAPSPPAAWQRWRGECAITAPPPLSPLTRGLHSPLPNRSADGQTSLLHMLPPFILPLRLFPTSILSGKVFLLCQLPAAPTGRQNLASRDARPLSALPTSSSLLLSSCPAISCLSTSCPATSCQIAKRKGTVEHPKCRVSRLMRRYGPVPPAPLLHAPRSGWGLGAPAPHQALAD